MVSVHLLYFTPQMNPYRDSCEAQYSVVHVHCRVSLDFTFFTNLRESIAVAVTACLLCNSTKYEQAKSMHNKVPTFENQVQQFFMVQIRAPSITAANIHVYSPKSVDLASMGCYGHSVVLVSAPLCSIVQLLVFFLQWPTTKRSSVCPINCCSEHSLGLKRVLC